MKPKYIYSVIAIVALILLGVIEFTPHGSSPVLGDAGVPNTLTNPTNTSVALTTNTSTKVLAASSGRLFAYICSPTTNATSTWLTVSNAVNASGTTIGVAATANNGIYLAVNTCFKIDSSDLLVGQINAFAAASNTLSVIYQ